MGLILSIRFTVLVLVLGGEVALGIRFGWGDEEACKGKDCCMIPLTLAALNEVIPWASGTDVGIIVRADRATE